MKGYTHLSHGQSYQLGKLLTEEYTRSGFDDVKFAAYAAERLGFSVKSTQVSAVRKELGIANNRMLAKPKAKTTPDVDAMFELLAQANKALEDLAARNAALHARIVVLETKVK